MFLFCSIHPLEHHANKTPTQVEKKLMMSYPHSDDKDVLPPFCSPGEHSWGAEGSESGSRRCPMCLTAGSVVRVCMGIEPAFYVDAGPPTYAFNPCGHMASERTVKWVILVWHLAHVRHTILHSWMFEQLATSPACYVSRKLYQGNNPRMKSILCTNV